jgi:hypothetical protein
MISAVIAAVACVLTGATIAAMVNALKAEIEGRVTRVPAGIVMISTRRLPEPERSELREEWMAELAQIAHESKDYPVTSWVRRVWRSMAFALDLYRAGRGIAREAERPNPVPRSAGHASGLTTYLAEEEGSRKAFEVMSTGDIMIMQMEDGTTQHFRRISSTVIQISRDGSLIGEITLDSADGNDAHHR